MSSEHTAGASPTPASRWLRPDDPRVQADPYPFYPLLRRQAPVLASDFAGQPCWILSRREDVARVLMDPTGFSSRTTPIPNMLFADPPTHGRLRAMVASMFTRTAVAPMAGIVDAKSRELLAPLTLRGRADIVGDFAAPLTITVIGAILGIPADEVEQLRELSRLMLDYVQALRLGRAPAPAATAGAEGLAAFIMGIVRARRYVPGKVVSALVKRFEADELIEGELIQFFVLLFVAGHSTTTNLIANAVFILADRPDDLRRLREDETFVPSFVEEVLRTRPSFYRTTRIASREMAMHGVTIPAGGVVRLLLASANRDEDRFDDPERFDPLAQRRNHLAFGQGAHACLGSWLARIEAHHALRAFAGVLTRLALDPDQPPVPASGGTFNEFGFESPPVLI